ncbi:MICAL-like protein 1 isoform X2 [Phlebotomus argentipes]|uniref:MICAL-like protein 1 isoform X2 n=1 Tax=Phlebotomus argentipes TaxID=94469 RepID=UPI002892AE98|nr:MICAL-like protein 1 isoform X2 [Phlebotomus argentipes]
MSAKEQLSRGVLRREPCFKCELPVFLAERLTIDGRAYHRTCLKCARCNHQLTPGSFYETEVDGEFCCEVCPDEEVKHRRSEEEQSALPVPAEEPTDMERQNSLLKKSLSDEAKRESLDRLKGKDQKFMLSFIETQFASGESVQTESDMISETLRTNDSNAEENNETSVKDKLRKLVLDDKEAPREVSSEIPCLTKDEEQMNDNEDIDDTPPNVPACNTSIQVPIVDYHVDKSVSSAVEESIEGLSMEADKSSDVQEIKEVETYPNKLNPFDSDEEEGATAREDIGKAQNLNPFDSDDDEIEEEKMQKEQKSSNPFDDASEDEAAIVKPSPRRTPIPTPRKTLAKNPNQYLLVTPGAIAKDFYGSSASLNSRNESHGSMNSLSSTSTGGGLVRHKKGKAPLPPSSEEKSSPKLSPRARKKRPAPPPPVVEKSAEPRRRLIPLDDELLTDGGVESEQSLLDASEVSYRRKIVPIEVSDTEESHERQWEKLKDNKDSKNRNRRSHIYQGDELDTMYSDKSAHGKWKKRKGPAPALPVPPKRVLQMLPLQEILHELEVIDVQQQGLEKQGITLEKIIRERCEGVENVDTSLNSDSLAKLPTQNTKEVEDLIMQLFDLVNEKNELFRRQAELMYLRRQHRLEQEQIDLEYEIRVLMAQPERNKTDSDKAKEEAMISRLVEVVQLRNEVVDNLEMDRLREAEEDLSIKQEIERHTAKRDESFREEVSTKLSKKEKKKQKEAKKLKNKKIDIDKDDDETESSGTIVRKKKKKFIII